MKSLVASVLKFLNLGYWIIVVTNETQGIYHFGPFINPIEAAEAKPHCYQKVAQRLADNQQILCVRIAANRELTCSLTCQIASQCSKLANDENF